MTKARRPQPSICRQRGLRAVFEPVDKAGVLAQPATALLDLSTRPQVGWGRGDFALSNLPQCSCTWVLSQGSDGLARGWKGKKEETGNSEVDQMSSGAQQKTHGGTRRTPLLTNSEPHRRINARPRESFQRGCDREQRRKRVQFERLNNFTQRD